MNVPEGRSSKGDCRRNIRKAALHKNNVGAVDCNVRSGSDCDSYIRGSKRGSIVYSVADHCDLSFFFKAADSFFLSFRKNSGNHFINANLLRNCFCGPLVVSGEHYGMDSHVFKTGNRFRAFFLYNVRNGDCSEESSVSAEEERSFSLFGKSFGKFFGFFRNLRGGFYEIKISAENGNSAENSGNAVSGKGIEIGNRRGLDFGFFGFSDNCLCERMFAF